MGWKLRRQSEKSVEQEETAQAPAAPVNGFFRGRERLVSGWILDLKNPQRKHEVEVFVGGKSIGKARGDRYDPLVQKHHGGDGRYAFAIYFAGDLSSEPVEAAVVDTETGTALRSKQPLVTRCVGQGAPLTIGKLRIGEAVELSGVVGAYPWDDNLGIELWSGEERVASSIPIAGNEADGIFSAPITGEALRHLLCGDVEIALPGLKEARLAVRLHKPPLSVVVSPVEDAKLRLELRGEFEQTGPIAAAVRFNSGEAAVEQLISINSKAAIIATPAGFRVDEGSVDVVISGVTFTARLEWRVLEDLQFRDLGTERSRWAVSDNATIDRGFFAFPDMLANEHELSGYIAHVARQSDGGSLRLSQASGNLLSSDANVSIGAFIRAAKGTKLTLRLRDDEGVLAETHATSRSSYAWSLLSLEKKLDRKLSGQLVFEAEASGRKLDGFDIAFTNSSGELVQSSETVGSNLVSNGDFQIWPSGAGVRAHSVRGDLCAGWRAFNRKTPDPIFSRAVMHPVDGSLGLAVAAPNVKHYLRLETDIEGPVTERPLTLRFRAGVPAAARQLLAQEVDAVPQFAVIDRVHLIRRLSITTESEFEQRDEVAGVFERKIPVGGDIEQFEYSLPPLQEVELQEADDSRQPDESYHLAFDFRHPTVVALFDVELIADESVSNDPTPPKLALEDRNIELQVGTLETVRHWRGVTPVRLATDERSDDVPDLKWSVGLSREPVEIIIPVFNALPETLACLESLGRSTTIPILVRLIDDGSDAQVYEALAAYAHGKPWVDVQRFAQNRGYTYAADYGIRNARTGWVVLLNSDTIVTSGWLEGMLQCARSNPDIAFVGPLSNAASYQSVPELYDASRKWKVNRLPPGVTPDDMADIVRRLSPKGYPLVPLLNGFCTLMKREVFVELGGLNPAAFPAGYGEENDLCLRASKAGAKLAVADDVYVYHVKSASFGNARREELTKGGNAALRKLHPDVDIAALTNRFRETPELVALRQAVAAELSKTYAPVEIAVDSDEPAASGEARSATPRSKTSDSEGLTCA